MLLYFQEALKGFYKHTFIKQILTVKAGYVMCQKNIHIINLFCFLKNAKRRESQLAAIELRNGKAVFLSGLFTVHGAVLFFPCLKIVQNRAYKLFSC